MSRTKFYVCWTMDCESVLPPISDPELGSRAIKGYARILEDQGWHGTFLAVPEEVVALADLIGSLSGSGHEVGIHLHPKGAGYPSDYQGTYSAHDQEEIVEKGMAVFAKHHMLRPVSARPGYASANDSTFPV